MARYLVVAHQTVTSPELLEKVRVIREQQKDAEFVLLVPATPVRHLLFRRGDEHDAEATARKRAERGRAVFAKKGLALHDAKVGAADPSVAIDLEVKADSGYTGFVISTLPAEKSHWLVSASSSSFADNAISNPPRRQLPRVLRALQLQLPA